MGRISNCLRERKDGWNTRFRRAMDQLAGAIAMPACADDSRASGDAVCESGYAQYLAVQSIASVFAACVATQPEITPYAETIAQAEDRYAPDGPPHSPLTASYFTAWSFYDLAIGPERETIGTCLVELGEMLGLGPAVVDAIDRVGRSRMGVYEHCGAVAGRVVLRELVTGRQTECVCPSGYRGRTGQIWFIRLVVPRCEIADCPIAITTPYVLTGTSRADWVAYLNRTSLQLDLAQGRTQRLEDLMKYGLSPFHWHDFIARALDHYRDDVIYLRGLPDVQGTLPPWPLKISRP